MSLIDNLKIILEKGQDDALLRYSLGNAYLHNREYSLAIEHLSKAIEHNPDYSAAWKAYARALAENNRLEDAVSTYEKGILIAEKKGDIQAAKEMKVFLKRLKK